MKKLALLFLISFPLFSNAQKVWGKEVWDIYVNSCVESAKSGFSEKDAYAYCTCTAAKLERAYPDPSKLGELQDDEMNELAAKCLDETGILNNDDTKTDTKTNSGTNAGPTPPGKAASAASAANKNKVGGATNWSKAGYDAFMNSCVDSAKDALGGETEARKYCDCSASKLQIMYPDETKVSQVTEEEINKIAAECLGN